MQELHETEREPDGEPVEGVLPSQLLERAVAEGWIVSAEPYGIQPRSIQPASIDLRLGEYAYELRCSFLPDTESSVEDKVRDLVQDKISISGGRTLEPERPYLIPLLEELRLPEGVRGKANPKSSTGRLDVFTRVITDNNNRFDEIPLGYHGKLYLEVVPRSFAVRADRFQSLNQLRLAVGDARVRGVEDLQHIHRNEMPLLYTDAGPVPTEDLVTADGLFLSVNLRARNQIVGYRAKKNSRRLDMSLVGRYWWHDFWEPVYPERGGRVVLEPEIFYLLLSAEGVCVPPDYAAEMVAYDPTAGELRTHYAGFFDPGFGYRQGHSLGTRAALEVRARDVAFMLEHEQPICKLAFERMVEAPDRLYGEGIGSHYQGQSTMLSKHFVTPGDDGVNADQLPGLLDQRDG